MCPARYQWTRACLRQAVASAFVVVISAGASSGTCGLSQLNIWVGEDALKLKPAFSEKVFQYTASLDYQYGGLWVEPVPTSAYCDARRSDSTVDIQPGKIANIAVSVRGRSSKKARDYVVSVQRLKGDDTTLRYLSVRGARIIPMFDPLVFEYSVFPLPNVPLVLVGIPTDSGQRMAVTSITPRNDYLGYESRADYQVKPVLAQNRGTLSPRGSRNITLGFLRLSSDSIVLQLPYSIRAGGRRNVSLPARVELRVWPAGDGMAAPKIFTLLLNAPRRAAFQRYNPPGGALQPLSNAASMLAVFAAKAHARDVAAAEMAAATITTTTSTSSSTTTSTTQALSPTPTPATQAMTDVAATNPPLASQASATPSDVATEETVPSWAHSQRDEGGTDSQSGESGIPSWAMGQDGGEEQSSAEAVEEKAAETDKNAAGPWILGVLGLLLILVIFKSCRVGGRPLYLHCHAWRKAGTKPFCEVPSDAILIQEATPQPVNVPLRPAAPEDAALLRAMVLGTT